ncbi:MAG: ferritin-like domain-containing protein [Rikenellaceae bacterium]
MKTISSEVLPLDVERLIETMNQALSEEWLAYYQYWIGARVIEGPLRPDVEKELIEHANEELGHAEKLVERIVQLGGTPVLAPTQWIAMAECQYLAPTDPSVQQILAQNISSERCAIKRYQELAAYTEGKDYTTFKIVVEILEEELEHENELIGFQSDIAAMIESIGARIMQQA